MRKPIDEKLPTAAWATLARGEAGMSVEEVVDALAERGHVVTAATLRGIEGGSKRGGARLVRLLAEVYGKPTPAHAALTPPATDMSALVAAITAQTAAIERLVLALGVGEADRYRALAEWAQAQVATLSPLPTPRPSEAPGPRRASRAGPRSS